MDDRTVNKRDIEVAFEESGERDNLREILALELSSCGWTREIEERIKTFIREQQRKRDEGEKVTLEEIVAEVRDEARRAIPASVKEEIMGLIRTFIENQIKKREAK
ncbi:hypothetical protein L596_007250 [Steinernema carpocapsae]|uniref:Transcription and mRNA export factor ENY2 n=1 Tax=Steinernema carpocapsae TaxID=34508 RepID=A0A4U5P9Q8_STECR|nr:hypothetical protein L596_007250 [Steinernema carpocapsae]